MRQSWETVSPDSKFKPSESDNKHWKRDFMSLVMEGIKQGLIAKKKKTEKSPLD
jgi:hypothetical protein